MRAQGWLFISLGLLAAAFVSRHSAGQDQPLRPVRPLTVLFLGNSYTYANDLPGMIAALAEAAGGQKIETAQYTPGGYTLQRHFLDGRAVPMIAGRKWDVVVLQEQSLVPVVDPKQMDAFGRRLHEQVQKQGAKTLLFLTWARQNKPDMQSALNDAYFALARALNAPVAPVGAAWANALQADPQLALHAKDGSHPSAQGSYLAACVFYATLLDKSPEGLPAELRKGGKTLVKLDHATAKRLQTIAWEAVRNAAPRKPTSTSPR